MYDSCIYFASYKAIQNKLNCSFGLFLIFNYDFEILKNESRECEIHDVASNISAAVFHHILSEANQGKKDNNLKYRLINDKILLITKI